MSRLKSVYRCQQCGYTSPKWLGQCAGCDAWNALVEEVVETSPASSGRKSAGTLTEFSSEVVRLAEIPEEAKESRRASRIEELDRILGGGLVGGQVVLLAGPPGIGKSTLMLQVAAQLALPAGKGAKGLKVLYISGEESLSQVSGRARRLGVRSEDIYLVSETNLAKILEALHAIKPHALILDSVQTVYHPDLTGSPGSVGQVRECAAEILRAAKSKGIITFLLGHITKEGSLAGPKILEHIVDTVLYFDTEQHHLLRVLRVNKNRFGPSAEMGLFEMSETGLRGVPDASAFFITERSGENLPGRAVSVVMEGSRPILVEVQALAASTRYPLPRRMATGLDGNRTMVLIAALEKHLRLHLENKDVFISLAGGMQQRDPALDLAVCMALVSSARDTPLPVDCVFVGEVGLLGQLGRVSFMPNRLKEAARLGFKKAVIPERSLKDLGCLGGDESRIGGDESRFGGLAVEDFDTIAACARAVSNLSEREPVEQQELS